MNSADELHDESAGSEWPATHGRPLYKGGAMDNAISVLQADITSLGVLALERRASDQRALALQASYTEKRLVDITLAHEQLRIAQAGFVVNVIYDRDRLNFEGQVAAISKLVYVGLGIAIMLEVALAFASHSFKLSG